MRSPGDGKLDIGRQPLVPRQPGRAVEQGAEISCRKSAHVNQHALAGTEPQIGATNRAGIRVKQQAPRRRRPGRIAKRRELAFDDRFGARRRGGDEF